MRVATVLAFAFVALTACAPTDDVPPAAAVWELADPDAVTSESTVIDLLVWRVECSSGVTGDLLPPTIEMTGSEIVIAIAAAPLPDGAYTCQGNDQVAVTVELDAAVGNRTLVDGGCALGDASETVYCQPDGRRWPLMGE